MMPTHRATHTQKCSVCKGDINKGDVLRQERLKPCTIKEKCGLVPMSMIKTCVNCLWTTGVFALYNRANKEIISYFKINYATFWDDLGKAFESAPRGTFFDIGQVRYIPRWGVKGQWECGTK